MLYEVLQVINNFFVDSYCDVVSFNDNVVTANEDLFIQGQYILIIGSKINDSVYKVESVDGKILTLDSELIDENVDDVLICSLSIPKSIITLVTEIETYNTNNHGGVKSESLGDYSVSYGNNDTSWITVFQHKLARYKKPYLNLPYKRNGFDVTGY